MIDLNEELFFALEPCNNSTFFILKFFSPCKTRKHARQRRQQLVMWVHICLCGYNIYAYYNLNRFHSVCVYTYFAYRLHKLNFFNKRTCIIYKTFIDPETGVISIVQYTYICAYFFTRFQVSFLLVLHPPLFTAAILIVLWKKHCNQLLSVYIYL